MKPQSRGVELLLTAITPIAHNDPAVVADTNIVTFNRELQRVALQPARLTPVHQPLVDAFCAAHPVPASAAAGLEQVTFAEFAACALTQTLMAWYTGGEGEGLLKGVTRYQMLEKRLLRAAISSHNLLGFVSRLTNTLQLSMQAMGHDRALVEFFAFPMVLQQAVLTTLVKNTRALVSIAREWNDARKNQSAEYAAAKSPSLFDAETFTAQPDRVLSYQVDDFAAPEAFTLIEVPKVSSNSIRHQLREAAWIHLTALLDIPATWPGGGPYPQSLEAMFRNGGNLSGSEPMGATQLAQNIRRTFPSLDLFGGCADRFTLDKSRLEVAAHLVCAENAGDGLPAWVLERPMSRVSAFELLDDVTQTRQAVNGLHQMIYTFEVLCKGTELYVRLHLNPFTHELTQGALLAAVDTWATMQNVIAGKAGEGFSLTTVQEMARQEMTGTQAQYEDYLRENAEYLRAELATGTLGSGSKTPLLS